MEFGCYNQNNIKKQENVKAVQYYRQIDII